MKKLKGTSESNISKTFLKLCVKNISACNKQEKNHWNEKEFYAIFEICSVLYS